MNYQIIPCTFSNQLKTDRRRDIGISIPAIILGDIISEVHPEPIHRYVRPIPGSSIKHSHFFPDLNDMTLENNTIHRV